MKKLLPPLFPILILLNADAQSNCMTPTSLQFCLSVI